MSLLARDVMQPHVVTVTPDTTLAAVADLLINQRISGVPVVERGAVVGVVSRSDFARLVSLERALAGLVAEAEGVEEYAPASVRCRLPCPRAGGAHGRPHGA
jgi:CBS domain-containing protein